MRAIIRTLCVLSFCVMIAAARPPRQNGSPAQTSASQAPAATAPGTIRVGTQLVVEEVTVKDKSGKPITGLTANDFTLTEDGVPQTINFAQFQRLEAAANPPETPPPSAAAAVPTAPPATRTPIAPEQPGDTRYRDHRLLALYFDLTTMQPTDQLRAFDAALAFIDKQMDSSEMLAVMTFEGGAVRVRQDFSGDRGKVRDALNKLIVGLSQGFDETAS